MRPKALLHYDPSLISQFKITKNIQIQRERDAIRIEGTALWIFSPENIIRKFFAAITRAQSFQTIILVLIVASTITLAFEDPLIDKEGK